MSRTRAASDGVVRWRFLVVSGLLLILVMAVVGRLVSLLVLDQDRGAEFLREQGAMRVVRTAEIPVYRGLVTDRRGEPLAVSTPVVSIWADPQRLSQSNRLNELAQALSMTESELRERIDAYSNKRFMYLLRHQTPDIARSILALNIKGVREKREYRRFYPAGEVTSQIVGLTNLDGEGIAGIENAYDDWLKGRPGRKRYIKDLHGDVIRDIGVVQEAVLGSELALSIDLRLQYLQHRELQRAMIETGADAGAAVTIDAWTGEILAMTNHPVYNPNSSRGSFDFDAARNRVVTDVFEPGSIMKPLTLVAALESGDFTIETLIDTAPGRIRVGKKVLLDPRNYGEITVSRVIEKSSQVGVTKMAQVLGHKPVLDVYRRFGLGEPSGIGFPGERSGMLPERSRWSEIEQVTLAFGYGLTATPLQIAHAYTVFANGGERIPLTLVRRKPGEFIPRTRVVRKDIAEKVLTVLGRVTGEYGTAKKARVDGFSVGGKTGTVHKVGPSGYIADQYIALFVGIAPIENPRYVTAIVVDESKGDNYGGGSAAAPVYARITDSVLRLKNVTPTVGKAAEPRVAGLEGG